jgi:hypothetical protein
LKLGGAEHVRAGTCKSLTESGLKLPNCNGKDCGTIALGLSPGTIVVTEDASSALFTFEASEIGGFRRGPLTFGGSELDFFVVVEVSPLLDVSAGPGNSSPGCCL